MSLVVVTTLIDILGLLALGVWKLLLFMGFFLHALVFLFSSMVHVCVSVCIGVCVFFLVMFCIFMKDKVTVFAC